MGADSDFAEAAFELGRGAGRGEGAEEGAPGEEETVRKKPSTVLKAEKLESESEGRISAEKMKMWISNTIQGCPI